MVWLMFVRGKHLALGAALVAVVVLGVFIWAARDRAREWWFLRELARGTGEERKAAARALVEMDSERAAPVLAGLLRQVPAGVEMRTAGRLQDLVSAASTTAEARMSWYWIGESMLALGEPGIEALLRLLAAGEGQVGLVTVPFLKQLDGTYLQRIAVLLLDERPEVFRPAASILSASERVPAQCVPLLLEALDGKKEVVTRAAVQALGRLGVAAECALPALRRLECPSSDLESVVLEAIEKITGDFD